MVTKGTPKGNTPTDEVSHRQMEKYLSKISGPLIDRIDIHVEVPPVPYQQLTGQRNGTDSAAMRRAVLDARKRQQQRTGTTLEPNTALTGRELDEHAALDGPARQVLREAMTGLGLSARAYDKVRRVARTIADLDHSDRV